MEFTTRNVVKYVTTAIVHGAVESKTEDIIVDHTSLEEDSMPVNIMSHVVGWYISDKLKPYTNQMVDKTADWLVARKNTKKTK